MSEITLYIHIPFCTRKCLFCSFVVAVGQDHRMDDYLSALDREAAHYSSASVKSVYFGGGTPSNLSVGQLKKLFEIVHKNFKLAPQAEISFEANPESIDEEKGKLLLELGVTRLSLGLQSFQSAYLKFLGRCHDREQAINAFDILRKAGFKNLNLDLMYGFPGQSQEELGADLRELIQMQSEHVSLYTLTIEPNSRFHAQKVLMDDSEALAGLYNQIVEALDQEGIKQYEISNFSRQGFESQHNRHYWLGGEYIGLGVGAHSYLHGHRSWNVSTLPLYFQKMKEGAQALEASENLSAHTRLMERILFGLRMNEGIDLEEIQNQTAFKLAPEKKAMLDQYVKDGFFSVQGNHLQTTHKGRLVLDELSVRLI